MAQLRLFRDYTVEAVLSAGCFVYLMLTAPCPLCLSFGDQDDDRLVRIIMGRQDSCHFLSEAEFRVRRPDSTDLRWDITRDDEQVERDTIRPENIFWETFKASRRSPFRGSADHVGCLIDRSVSMSTQRCLRGESDACIIHEDCFAVFSQMVRRKWPGMNIPDTIWIMVQTLRPPWIAAHPRVPSERRKAMQTAAVAGENFAQLRDLFATTDVQATNVFRSLHALPDELKLLVANELECSPLHDSLVLLQQFQEVLPLIHGASRLLPGVFDIRQDIYVEAASFGGRQYLINVREEPFPHSTRIFVPDTPRDLIIEFDDIGIVSLKYIDKASSSMHTKRHIIQLPSWYRMIKMDDASPLVSLKRKGIAFDGVDIPDQQCDRFSDIPPQPSWMNVSEVLYGFSPPGYNGPVEEDNKFRWQRNLTISDKTRAIVVVTPGEGWASELLTIEDMNLPTTHFNHVHINRSLAYQYFPIAPGEEIMELWVVKPRGENSWCNSIALRTSHGREAIFGSYPEPYSAHITPQRICVYRKNATTLRALTYTTKEAPTRGGYDLEVGCSYERAMETSKEGPPRSKCPVINSPLPPPLRRLDQEDYFGDSRDWYYSSASLAGLRSFQLCIDIQRQDEHTVGMMLYYDNDRRECLGQWRGDCKASPMHTLPCLTYLYRYRFSNGQLPSIKVVVHDSSSAGSVITQGLDEFPTSGRLVWWFSKYGNVLDHIPEG